MKSYLSLAWKELKAQRLTSLLILIAIVMSSMVSTAMGQSVGILRSMRASQAAGLNGDRYATFHQLSEEQDKALHEDERLRDVGSIVNVGSVMLGNSGLTMYLREYGEGALRAYKNDGKIQEGRLPEGEMEIALSEEALKYLGFKGQVGDKLSLPVSVSLKNSSEPPYEFTGEFLLTGILEENYTGYVSGSVNGILGEGTAKKLLPRKYYLFSTDFKTKSTEAFQETVNSLREGLGVLKEDIQYNWILLDTLGIDYEEKGSSSGGEGFPYMMAACVVTGLLVLLAAGLVIYNILKVAVVKRIREYGTLRAIGGERRQLYLLVTVQLLLLCGMGIPVGTVLGIFSSRGILTGVTGFLTPDVLMASSSQEVGELVSGTRVGSVWPVVIGAAVTLAFAAAAAFPSARYAAGVSPVSAMRGTGAQVKRRGRKNRRIRSFEAYYARLNLRRSKGRTAVTVLSLVMSITVFVALQSFVGILDASRQVAEMHQGDYSVTSETVGFSPEAVEEMKSHELVEGVSMAKREIYKQDEKGALPLDFSVKLKPAEAFYIASVDEDTMKEMAPELAEEDVEALRRGEACLVKNPIPFSYEGKEVPRTELKQGEVIALGGRELKVAGISGGAVLVNNEPLVNGVQVIVADALYNELTGKENFLEIYPTLKEGADREAFEAWLEDWCGGQPGSHWLSYQKTDAQLTESFEQIRLLCWGLILFIGLIGVLNIINTVYTNIHTRVNEIGMQRAIGMSGRSLYKTFLWEGAYYGLMAAAIGAVCGYGFVVLIEAAVTEGFRLVPIPLIPILEAAAVSILACLAATALPLRGIARRSIVSSIETAE